ncbi:MAG: NADH-quinone oxidoreductase subunit NuoF [Promethearchaeota archaeon]|nr:MAG: NADH-quinone oxidoreductase subunit NuoF [Candidatus Lokiarchaeota archaeon]
MNDLYKKRKLLMCRGTACNSMNAGSIYENLKKLIAQNNLDDYIEIKQTGCHGFCQVGPTIIVKPDNVLYTHLKNDHLEDIIEKHLKKDQIVQELLYKDPRTGDFIENMDEIPFYKEQKPLITENCGIIDPEDIQEYISSGGYCAIEDILEKRSPQDVLNEIKESGLRGRGGAGFPTGIKWSLCRQAEGNIKYLICNGDEGDPGAFMDRSILESDPHRVIEGMLIAGYAIGANKGFAYIRAEYPLAIERFNIALKQAEEEGYLGSNILNSGFNFTIELKKGAGAFVCGEETALMASIMGKRGMPRPKPPYPAVSGLWNKPTNINNVKTLATVPKIIRNGAEWYKSIGTENAPGTTVLALSGKIINSGLVELPLGTSIRKLVFEIGGGIPDGKEFKAVQTGGPSGGCIPKEYIDTPLDYKHLTELGSIMGSGGCIVLDENSCMVEIARYFISFCQRESCGKCVPCRIGTKRMLEILTKITEGKANMDDLDELEKLANLVKETSLCGLGKTAPNPVITTLKYFRDEYIAHIKEKRCPALVCKDLIEFCIDPEKCIGCGVCKDNCSSGAIEGKIKEPHKINTALCVKCGLCYSSCSQNAIYKISNPIEKRGI